MKTWLITGISSGLGKALATAAMDTGDFVIGTFRNRSQVSAFNATHAGKGYAYELDITDYKAMEEVMEDIQTNFDRIDILVNNAGLGFIGAIEEASLTETRMVMEANFFGTLELTRKVLPIMRQQQSGRIIQVSSHGGLKAFAGFGIYNASKFALEGFSEALAQEVEPFGIKLTLLEPGPFRTAFAGKGLAEAKIEMDDYAGTAGVFRQKLRSVDGKQEGDPAKAAEAIIQLAQMTNPPLRLPLGKTALVTIGMKLDSVQSDLENGRQIAAGAVFS